MACGIIVSNKSPVYINSTPARALSSGFPLGLHEVGELRRPRWLGSLDQVGWSDDWMAALLIVGWLVDFFIG